MISAEDKKAQMKRDKAIQNIVLDDRAKKVLKILRKKVSKEMRTRPVPINWPKQEIEWKVDLWSFSTRFRYVAHDVAHAVIDELTEEGYEVYYSMTSSMSIVKIAWALKGA